MKGGETVLRLRAFQTMKAMLRINGLSTVTAIDRVIRDEDPVIRELAEITNKIFLEIAHKLTTSTIKQTFQRLFIFIYLKKLKLLYKYNLPKDLTGSPMGIKEIRNDKEAIISDHYEDGLVKNESASVKNAGFPSALEHSSEEK